MQICHTCESVDSVADLDLPLLTQHDVECIKTFSKVGGALCCRNGNRFASCRSSSSGWLLLEWLALFVASLRTLLFNGNCWALPSVPFGHCTAVQHREA